MSQMQVIIQEATNSASVMFSEKNQHDEEPVTEEVRVPCVGHVRAEDEEQACEFSLIPRATPIDIAFENVKFTAVSGVFKKTSKQILHRISGRLPQGQLIAIMGPSGAGKSTLLDVLSGYRITGIEGNVYINGVIRDLNAFRKVSCYITQDDRLQGLLTVQENMEVAADLKLGSNTTAAQKETIITNILNTLGLDGHRSTHAERLSGGQKKRLSIALELVNNPQVMFLDEPTTGLDSSSCKQCVELLQLLARQGRTIICTIHQPSASLFQLFDQVYVLSSGQCLYQGSTENLVPFLEQVGCPCPQYHNPADFVIELSCGEHGYDKIERMVKATDNGNSLRWMKNSMEIPSLNDLREKYKGPKTKIPHDTLLASTSLEQLQILLRRGVIKAKRDTTLTYLRIITNVLVALMLGAVYWQAGWDGSKVLDNYNLLFSILMHHMMSTMMLTILTFPNELSILIKEHFNRWYSLKMYYTSITIVDIPIATAGCVLFTILIYIMTGQPLEWNRFCMFAAINLLVVFVAQSVGLMIGAVFNVINGTFLGPTIAVPMMMFAGFGVAIKDLPSYLYWGSYVSYLRYGLEGIVGAIYGMDREVLECPTTEHYCHYRYPKKFTHDIDMKTDQFWNDVIALTFILFFFRIGAYVLLRWKLMAVR